MMAPRKTKLRLPALTATALFVTGLGILATSAPAPRPSDAAETRAPVVVELFTSQSCSSCPPADEFLTALAKKKGIIALSLHVTYWNYLGWKDNLSSKAATRRQKTYRWSLRQSMIYTPQMIVHGRHAAVGSNMLKVANAIGKVQDARRASVPVLLTVDGGKLRVVLAAAKAALGSTSKADVMLFLVDRRHTRKIGAGENSGKTLTYTNVVREIRRIGAYSGEEVRLTAAYAGSGGAHRDRAVVLVQGPRVGPIYGAAMVNLP